MHLQAEVRLSYGLYRCVETYLVLLLSHGACADIAGLSPKCTTYQELTYDSCISARIRFDISYMQLMLPSKAMQGDWNVDVVRPRCVFIVVSGGGGGGSCKESLGP